MREDIPEESQQRENLNKIIKLATRCRIIAKALLNLGRSTSKTYSPVDLNVVIKDMFSMVEDHKIFKKLEMDFRLEPNLPHFMGDRGQMEQVVLNLLINAAEAIERSGTIRVETRYVEGSLLDEADKRDFVLLMVEDTGHGISSEILQKIFEPFFTTKRRGKGTGLGLSITRGIVQRHGGRIVCESKLGKGTKFIVEIPVNLKN